VGRYALVFPALILNYTGQAAYLLHKPDDVVLPFWRSTPHAMCAFSPSLRFRFSGLLPAPQVMMRVFRARSSSTVAPRAARHACCVPANSTSPGSKP
jgi:hypothetical protein